MPNYKLEKLRTLRVSNGWSIKKVADMIDMYDSSYGRLERGKRPVTLIEAKRLADLFNLTIDDLFYKE